MTFHINELSTTGIQYYLQHIVAPRPVCFASTTDKNGCVNLSPFSFFNLFSATPPIVVFSPARRVRDNTVKHTLQNILELPEVVINVVTSDMVQQVSLSSCDYPKGTDEFLKAGFTKEKATLVQPPMVKESKAKLECRVTEIKSLGENGGAGQLIIAEILCFHIDNEILTSNKKVMQEKLELIARMGGDWYARISPATLFKVDKPGLMPGIGIDALPGNFKTSRALTGNHLAQFASVQVLPLLSPDHFDEQLNAIQENFQGAEKTAKLHAYAKKLLDEGRREQAWQVMLRADE